MKYDNLHILLYTNLVPYLGDDIVVRYCEDLIGLYGIRGWTFVHTEMDRYVIGILNFTLDK